MNTANRSGILCADVPHCSRPNDYSYRTILLCIVRLLSLIQTNNRNGSISSVTC